MKYPNEILYKKHQTEQFYMKLTLKNYLSRLYAFIYIFLFLLYLIHK